jgi:thiol-disulfide isomerase/thioredoxin
MNAFATTKSLTLPMLREQFDEKLKNHKEQARWITEGVRRFEKVLGKPAADWETKDLEGKVHALKDYRGKVVILDFWYRGCDVCIRAMPQFNRLATDFKNEPIAVLGMNTNEDEKRPIRRG